MNRCTFFKNVGSVALAMSVALVPALAAESAFDEVPLAPRSTPAGATMFTTLAPEVTGVATMNRYADPEMWGRYYQELAYGAMGCGVAVGDFDNDGRPDIFAVSKTERCRLFRNLGDWKFADVTDAAGLGAPSSGWGAVKSWIGLGDDDEKPVEAWQQGATFADINNDGWLDLYVCRFAAPNRLYVNQRDGTFKEDAAARGLAVTDASGMAAFCDYDRDGWLDVYVQTNMLDAAAHPGGQRDFLFRNNRDGTFTNVTDAAGISGETSGHSATWWDYDGDGWPDLYVANDYAVPDQLYRNNGDGTFTNVVEQVMPHLPYYAMGADLGDVDNDGLIDLFVGDMAPTTHEKDQRGMAGSRSRAQTYADDAPAPQYMRNALFLNTGRGVMREAAYLAGVAASDWTWSARLEDFDNDGRLDLHLTNGMIREYHNADLLDKIMAVEDRAGGRRVVRESPVLAEQNLAFRNLGDVQFENVSESWGLDHVGVSFGAATGDFDSDGDLDLVYANYEAGHTLLRNDSPGGHRVIIALRGTRSNKFGVGANVRIETSAGTQVRSLVLARGYLSSSEPVLHFGLGEAEEILALTVEWPSGHVQTLRDLAVDRRFTIVEPGGEPPPHKPVELPAVQFVAEPSAGNREPGATKPVPNPGGAQPLVPFRVPETTVTVAADFDRDGYVDEFSGARVLPGRYPLPPRSTLRLRRGNELADATDNFAPGLREVGMVTAALASDVDDDGWIDLVVALDWGGVRYFRNNGGRVLEDRSEAAGFAGAGTGWWTSLASADFNRDGKPDFVAGNVGLNTPYRASATHPALVFHGDFRGGGAGGAQLIEAYYEGDRLLPRRTRNDLSAQIPAIGRRFPKVDDYAKATLEEIVGQERLAAARRFAATELRSGVFLSQAGGTYRFQPLPHIAQIAPMAFVAAGDFDGDGHADIFAAQNSHAPIAAIGRFDGGVSQLFRGDGRGGFSPIPPHESGLIATGEPRSLAVVDLDANGWPDIALARRGGSSLAFRNQGVAGRASLCVELRGPAGNPSAAGARITADFADGSTQMSEVFVGDSDAPKVRAACFFGYATTNPPGELRVRWPSGVTSRHRVAAGQATVTVSAPEP